MNNRQRQNMAKFHAYLSAARHLQDIVGARICYPDTQNSNEDILNKEYLRIAARLEKIAMKYRNGFD